MAATTVFSNSLAVGASSGPQVYTTVPPFAGIEVSLRTQINGVDSGAIPEVLVTYQLSDDNQVSYSDPQTLSLEDSFDLGLTETLFNLPVNDSITHIKFTLTNQDTQNPITLVTLKCAPYDAGSGTSSGGSGGSGSVTVTNDVTVTPDGQNPTGIVSDSGGSGTMGIFGSILKWTRTIAATLQAGISVSNFPSSTSVSNFPSTQTVSGSVVVTESVPLAIVSDGSVATGVAQDSGGSGTIGWLSSAVKNLRLIVTALQGNLAVAGTVAVSNLPGLPQKVVLTSATATTPLPLSTTAKVILSITNSGTATVGFPKFSDEGASPTGTGTSVFFGDGSTIQIGSGQVISWGPNGLPLTNGLAVTLGTALTSSQNITVVWA